MSALDTQIGGSHYKDNAIQPVQYIEANGLGFLEGCVVKRLTRHNKPTGKGRQDIEKAIHELQLLLELRYPPAVPFPFPDQVQRKLEELAALYDGCLVCGDKWGHGGLSCPKTRAASFVYTNT